ncbi:MAG: hypothetical protein ACQESF_05715 [Nanobdellota archaeon]
MTSKKQFYFGLGAVVAGLALAHGVKHTEITPPELTYDNNKNPVIHSRGLSTYGYDWPMKNEKCLDIEKENVEKSIWATFENKYGRHPYALEREAMKILNGGEGWSKVYKDETVKLASFKNYDK